MRSALLFCYNPDVLRETPAEGFTWQVAGGVAAGISCFFVADGGGEVALSGQV